MINTNFRQGTFKKWDDLVIIDPCNTNAWRIVTLLDNYGKYEDINVIILYKSGEEYMKTTKNGYSIYRYILPCLQNSKGVHKMTKEQYISHFFKKDSLFIVRRKDGTLVLEKVLQDYIPNEEYIYTEATILSPGSKPYNATLIYTALINAYKEPFIFIVTKEY